MAISRTPGYSTPAAAKATSNAARARLAAQNMGPGDLADQRAVQQLNAAGTPPRTQVMLNGVPQTYTHSLGYNKSEQLPVMQFSNPLLSGQRMANVDYITQQKLGSTPAGTRPLVGSGGAASGGRSGGGGGAAAAPQMSQAMIDWIASLLKAGAPQSEQFQGIDLPDYQQQAYRDFDPSMYNNLRTSLGQATTQDQATIDKSRQDMLAFLSNNYRNAFANADVSGGPMQGMNSTDMSRLLADQGVSSNPQYAGVQAEGQRAQQMAGDWRQAMAGNEDIMQRARIGNANTTADQNSLALQALSRAGLLGVGQQETAARGQWQQGADQWNEAQRQAAYQAQTQEALTNWQRQNQVTDTNAQNTGAYRNQMLQALLDLAGKNVGNTGVTLPTLQSLGLA